ncbi:MAG TPA: anhydro-N-acetylmuramic acid kinase [Candidatus Sulfotelmatobacter sp.]|jgi:anhydro-N-acetylmuramic acid kinase|nr:anhydro-N-acetylmuramic acid kinase [Candidatus Sulfotelmatobacter sp.]
MPKNSLLILGLMSGTSADGIEAALVRISGAPPKLNSKLLGHHSLPIPRPIRAQILRIAEGTPLPAAEISQLNFRLGQLFAEAAIATCKKVGVPLKSLDLIASHGQTIFHQGPRVLYLGAKTSSTLQIGEPSIIAARTGITTIADFRPADMAAGGQGAPLVPFADYLLYRHEKIGRVSLNLGGIANVTVIPAHAKPADVFAFDTGPANILIDALVSHFTKGRQHFDKNARLAQRGRCLTPLLETLLRDPYFRLHPPKSTGREYFGSEFVTGILQQGRKLRARPEDLIHTTTIFTALSVVDALNRFILPRTKIAQLIVSGGGARNPLLMCQLEAALAPIAVLTSEKFAVPEQSKEAYAFALLAYETFHHRPSNLPSATGASRPAILGKISYA